MQFTLCRLVLELESYALSSESGDKLQVLHDLLLYVLGKLATSTVKIFSIFCNREKDLVLKLC